MTVRFRTVSGVLFALFVMGGLVAAQQQAPALLDAKIPLDPTITTGEFDNGLKYFIKANNEPAQRAELRLVVNVGSIVEDDDQQGLAHFVEHMAFNGTEHYPAQALVDFMESVGMRFGPSVNAYTSFDETVYMLRVPTDTPEIMEQAFLILHDWASAVSFAPAEIDKERGVVLEEWRLGRGANARMLDQQFPTLLDGSRYAERLPIGKPEILENFPHERLTQFYKDWYRPDLMAVVAVGDFDAAAVRAQIERHFGALPRAAAPRPRPSYEVPNHPGTLYAVATDPEASNATVAVYGKFDLRDPTTYEGYRRSIMEGLVGTMFSQRFGEITQKPDAPFLSAGTGRGLFVRTKEASILSALVNEDGIDEGLAALFQEVERATRFGFTETELDRSKTNLLRQLERAVTERNNRNSASLAAEYIRHYLQRETVPGIELEFELAGRFLPEITLAEVNAIARDWMPDGSRVVLVSAPEKPGLIVPSEDQLRDAIASVADADLEAYVDDVGEEPLLAELPAGGTVVETTPADEYGISEWRLSNGVRVVLVPTTFKDDEIVMRAFSPGGTSLASDADYTAASTATQIQRFSGLGEFNSIDLRKKLTGKVAGASTTIGELEESVGGNASKKDLETMFQLAYLAFTQPRFDPQLFEVITTQSKVAMANQMADPNWEFTRVLNETLSQGHPRSRMVTPEIIDEMDLAKSEAFYRDRFADASDFTFMFGGSFTLDEIKPLVERYIGGLPSIGRTETWRDIGVRYPTGVVEREVRKGLEPQSQTRLIFTGPFDYNREQRLAIRAMASILQTRLRNTLREDLGGTYSVGASASYERAPIQQYTLNISFGSAPDRADALAEQVFAEIATYKAEGPTEQEVRDAVEAFVRDYETNMESNGYLLSQLAFKYRDNEPVDGVFTAAPFYRSLTVEQVHAAARLYLNTGNYVKVVLKPETGGF